MADGAYPDKRWSKIDRLEIGGYPYLSDDDFCLYLLERKRGTFEVSQANSIVNNFQKSVEQYGDRPEVMAYKENAIAFFANEIELLIAHKQRRAPIAIVPMITSKPKSAQWHDWRLSRTATLVAHDRSGEVVVRDILDVDEQLVMSKTGGSRRPEDIARHIVVTDTTVCDADVVFLIDDVITTGGHFAACKAAIKPYFPHAQIVGVFLARQEPIDCT